jgi:hypothetical protein
MKKKYSILLSISFLSISLPVLSQIMPGHLYGPLTVGQVDEPQVQLYGELVLMPDGELHLGDYTPGLQTNELHIIGNYTGDEGSRIFMSVTDNTNTQGTRGHIDIEGTAIRNGGSTQIILDMFDANNPSGGWNGNPIDLISSTFQGSDVNAFGMAPIELANGRTAALLHREEGNRLIWYIGEHDNYKIDPSCLDVIVQKRNHTLIVNNNPESNGGYNFVKYIWFKDGVEIMPENELGYYYTQFNNFPDIPALDDKAEYYAELTDINGNTYVTCPYTPVMLTDFKINVYPNPVQAESTINVDLEGLDWTVTSIGIYDAIGRLMLEVPAEANRTLVVMPRTPGTYIVKIKSAGVLKQTKIIVK